MIKIILIISISFYLFTNELNSQNIIASSEKYEDKKGFKFKLNLEYGKILVHNVKIEPILNDSIRIIIEASLLDSNLTNTLSDISISNIALWIDSCYIGHPIELNCTKTQKVEGIDLGFVVDGSGSMGSSISEYDNEIRINALKYSLNRFIENLNSLDSAFLLVFSNNIFIQQDWTNDKVLLQNACNSIYPMFSTQFYGAILNSINMLNRNNSRPKAIIALSDGVNNVYPEWSIELLKNIAKSSKNTKIYVVALGLGDNKYDIEGRIKMNIIAELTGGRYFDIYTSQGLDSIYRELSNEINYNKQCKIIFKAKSIEPYSLRLIELFINSDNSKNCTFASEIPFIDVYKNWKQGVKCDNCIRVRFCTAENESDYYVLLSALKSMGYKVKDRSNKLILDLISVDTFENENEANMFLEEFLIKVRIFPNKINTNKINTGIYYNEQESILPQFNISSTIFNKLFNLPQKK